MTPSTVSATKSITDVLAPDEARAFLDMVRIVQQRADRETLVIRDEEGEPFGFLVLPVFGASPEDPPTDPEFLKELERRMQSPEPAIPVEEFLEFLQREELPDEDAPEA